MSEEVHYDIAMLSDIQVSPEGDFVLASLYPSIQQDLQHWLELSKAELFWDEDFYSDFKKYLSKPGTPANLELMRSKVELFLRTDERVEEVESVSVVPDTINHLVTIAAKIDGIEIFARVSQ
jgi:hypothetical protein